ncbi:hypothetical protein Q7P37_006542 [Cladosporium fusiforme]
MASISQIATKHRPDLDKYEALYKHFHANPELSNQEKETAARCVSELQAISSDFDIRTNIGGHGLAAILTNGSGPTVLLRADFDALPIQERTGLPYASKKRMVDADGVEKPVMHACGHDMHISCMLGAAEALSSARESWAGTLVFAFQPAEERGTGAQAMVDDGLYDPKRHNVPIPDIVLGAHVMPHRAGVIGTRKGLIMSAADSMRITLHGRGGHASMPHRLVDPVIMAASTVMRLQGKISLLRMRVIPSLTNVLSMSTPNAFSAASMSIDTGKTIVSREVDPYDTAVVTCASIQAGDAENVVIDDARLAIDVRTTNPATRKRTLASIKRIVDAEALAGNAVQEPTYQTTRSFPLTINDAKITEKLEGSFSAHFPPRPARPYSFFVYGGTAPELWDKAEKEDRLSEDLPVNHSGLFAPVVMPTLQVGLDGYVVAALTWLAK